MKEMIEHLNIINTLHSQIEALLDLMQGADESVDINTVNVASEMCQTMLDDLMAEVEKIDVMWRRALED